MTQECLKITKAMTECSVTHITIIHTMAALSMANTAQSNKRRPRFVCRHCSIVDTDNTTTRAVSTSLEVISLEQKPRTDNCAYMKSSENVTLKKTHIVKRTIYNSTYIVPCGTRRHTHFIYSINMWHLQCSWGQ